MFCSLTCVLFTREGSFGDDSFAVHVEFIYTSFACYISNKSPSINKRNVSITSNLTH
jgi:hypothetical protein